MASNISQNNQGQNFMKAALRLARRGFGKTWPNPMVGAVLVHNNKIIAQGCHQHHGGLHAEANLFKNLTKAVPTNTILYLTLEPCIHFEGKKNGACTDLIINNKIHNVVIAMKDPNPNVSGKGINTLRKAGIKVNVGIMEEEAEGLNEVYTKYISTGLPFITVKIATSLDGKIATSTGSSRWITSVESREYVHILRSQHDGILTSSSTVIADNPHLGVRLKKQEKISDPHRIIIDRFLKTDPDLQVYRDKNVTILTSSKADISQKKNFLQRGIDVVVLKENSTLLDYLKEIPKRKIYNIMVEAGGKFLAALLKENLVDTIIYFLAPKIIGAEGISAIGNLNIKNIDQALTLQKYQYKKIGSDIMLIGKV